MKKSNRPETKVKNKEPNISDPDWIVWAAWADRITFEEIFEKTGKSGLYYLRSFRRGNRGEMVPGVSRKIQ